MDPMPRSTLLRLLESRYDYYSARVVYKRTLQRAGLADAEHFNSPDAQRFVDALNASGDQRAEAVAVRLWRQLGLTPDDQLQSLEASAPSAPNDAQAASDDAPATPAAQPAADTQVDVTEEPAATATPAEAPTPAEETPVEETPVEEAPSAQAQVEAAAPDESPAPSPEDAAPPTLEEVQVRWTFEGVALKEGQALRVCGDHAALGQWNPEQAPVCVPTEDEGWAVTLSVPPGTVMTFKGVVCRDDAEPVWENIPNRVLEIASEAVEASATWNGPTQRV